MMNIFVDFDLTIAEGHSGGYTMDHDPMDEQNKIFIKHKISEWLKNGHNVIIFTRGIDFHIDMYLTALGINHTMNSFTKGKLSVFAPNEDTFITENSTSKFAIIKTIYVDDFLTKSKTESKHSIFIDDTELNVDKMKQKFPEMECIYAVPGNYQENVSKIDVLLPKQGGTGSRKMKSRNRNIRKSRNITGGKPKPLTLEQQEEKNSRRLLHFIRTEIEEGFALDGYLIKNFNIYTTLSKAQQTEFDRVLQLLCNSYWTHPGDNAKRLEKLKRLLTRIYSETLQRQRLKRFIDGNRDAVEKYIEELGIANIVENIHTLPTLSKSQQTEFDKVLRLLCKDIWGNDKPRLMENVKRMLMKIYSETWVHEYRGMVEQYVDELGIANIVKNIHIYTTLSEAQQTEFDEVLHLLCEDNFGSDDPHTVENVKEMLMILYP